MELKRVYDHGAPKSKWRVHQAGRRRAVNPGKLLGQRSVIGINEQLVPPVRSVRITRRPRTGVQHFTPELVRCGIDEGWLSMVDGVLTIHAENGAMTFNITREPGRYCCHCGQKLTDDGNGAAARVHVATAHPGAPSPDPENPSGYCCINYFDCVLGGA
jgi:hypothetical protein